MAIKKFPFSLNVVRGGHATVRHLEDGASFDFLVTDKKGVKQQFIWKPTNDEVRLNEVTRKPEYTEVQYQAISGFWAIYND